MKTIIKIILIISLLIPIFCIENSFAENIEWLSKIDNSIDITWTSNDISDTINNVWLNVLSKIKYVFSWVLIIFLVYAWAQMIISMWTDEESLTSSKKSFLYSLIWLVFINIPWVLYSSFKWNTTNVNWWIWSSWNNDIVSNTKNLFINIDVLEIALNDHIIKFLEIILIAIAILVIIISWIKMILSAWKEDNIKEGKNKIIWSIVWLIFVWFIEAWQKFAYTGNISDWTDIFKTIANLILFFAWPIAIFFLTLAWYYYITSNWDEEKAKKWKNIVINTILATAILLCSYIFLNDLITL